MTRRLTLRQLNRTLLDRQWLLRRRTASPIDVAHHLVGIQAQLGDPPYYAIWSRTDGASIDDISSAIIDRNLARVVLMRGTIHLATADDCLNLRAIVQPHLSATLWSNTYGKKVIGAEPAAILEAGLAALHDGPLTNRALSDALASALPGYDGNALAYLLRSLTPLVQVPPRGVWGKGGTLRYASARQWFGREPGHDATPDSMVMRYLAAFGPASTQDIRRWSALSGVQEILDRLRPQLTTYVAPDGQQLFDLADSAITNPDVPAPARLVAPFDNVLMWHTNRERIIDAASTARMTAKNGLIAGTFLCDGLVAGTWKPSITKASADITFTAHRPLTPRERDDVEVEAHRTLAIAAPHRPVRITFGSDT